MMNIYVGNLPYSVKSDELREAFEEFGPVSSAEVIFDRRTKRSRGYGFVEMDSEDAGRRAIEALNGSDYKGRELRVDESQPKEQKTSRPEDSDGETGQNVGRNGSEDAPGGQPGGLVGFVRKLFG